MVEDSLSDQVTDEDIDKKDYFIVPANQTYIVAFYNSLKKTDDNNVKIINNLSAKNCQHQY